MKKPAAASGTGTASSSPGARKVRLKDVAAAAGVSTVAVSLALNDRPGLAPATRRRLRALAEKMGYRPDPALAALAAYRTRTRAGAPAGRGVLAYLTGWDPARPDGAGFVRPRPFDGARERARFYGYELEAFTVTADPRQQRRLGRILFHRGIQGLLIGANPRSEAPLDLPWNRFSTVVLGYSHARPGLNSCRPHYAQNIALCLERLWKRGYRRVGFVQTRGESAWVNHDLAGACDQARWAAPAGRVIVPSLVPERLDAAGFASWYREHRPEAVLTNRPDWVAERARAEGLDLPGELGLVDLDLQGETRAFAGIRQNLAKMGAHAVDALHGLLLHGQRGLPSLPVHVLVDGSWEAGRSLARGARPRSTAYETAAEACAR